MNAPRTPFDRILPAWLAVSVVVHAGAFAAAALWPERKAPDPVPLRWVVAGTVKPPAPPQATTAAQPAPRLETPAVSAEPTPPRQHVVRAERAQPLREARNERTVAPRESAQPAPRPATEESPGGDRLASLPQGASASAPQMGRPGAAFDGPLAGGDARPLTGTGGGPVGFAVTAPARAGGSGPGLGGSGSGLGAGGSASGIGGGGTPGGEGLGSGGAGGSGSGHVVARGTVGAGPGAGAGAAPPARSASTVRHEPAPPPAPVARPQPPPAPKPTVKPEPAPEPPPPVRPTAADLSRFRALVQSRIQSARRYPTSARQQGQEGTVRVSFSISPSGRPSGISVASSSGIAALDNEAMRAVGRAAPFRPFPEGLDSPIQVTATVTFRLN